MQATLAEIKALAREQLAEHGTGAVNLRAIARAMGTASSALYRYFPSTTPRTRRARWAETG